MLRNPNAVWYLMKRVFVVAMADSVHTARWLSQFANQNIFILLFPSSPHRRIHPIIKELSENNSNILRVQIAPWMHILALPLWFIDRLTPLRTRSRILRYLIDNQRPQILHGMETQNAGYLIAETIPHLQHLPTVYHSIWGSDLFWFRQLPKHRSKIHDVLSKTDALSTECKRDIDLAKEFGFKGRLLPTIPASGGLDSDFVAGLEKLNLPSHRSRIMVKGYSGFTGRSLTAIEVLEQMSDELKSFDIHVYSASLRTRWRVFRVRRRSTLKITTHKKHALSHSEVMSMLRESRLSLSISLSDGFPGSLREAMIAGCFPIESKYSCGSEWTIAGKSALFVDPRDTSEIIGAIRIAISDDALVDDAASTNFRLASESFSKAAVATKIKNYYSWTDERR